MSANSLPPSGSLEAGGRIQPGLGLEELAQYIRETLPLPNTITDLRLNPQAGCVELTWQTRHVVVTRGLDVFELKGKNLFVTGISTLIGSVLAKKQGNTRVIEALTDSLAKVEDLLKGRRYDTAFALLESVKHALKKEAGSASAVRR